MKKRPIEQIMDLIPVLNCDERMQLRDYLSSLETDVVNDDAAFPADLIPSSKELEVSLNRQEEALDNGSLELRPHSEVWKRLGVDVR